MPNKSLWQIKFLEFVSNINKKNLSNTFLKNIKSKLASLSGSLVSQASSSSGGSGGGLSVSVFVPR